MYIYACIQMITMVKIINVSPHIDIFLCMFVTDALETYTSEHIFGVQDSVFRYNQHARALGL